MPLMQLIYHSQPFGFDDAMLDGILLQARRNNVRDSVTGALIVRGDIYLQLLEGPEAVLMGLYDRIVRDDRHLAVRQIGLAAVERRMFPEWSMRDDPARSWIWSAAEVADGVLDRVGLDAVRGKFERLAAS